MGEKSELPRNARRSTVCMGGIYTSYKFWLEKWRAKLKIEFTLTAATLGNTGKLSFQL
jgi:hypothetical protein